MVKEATTRNKLPEGAAKIIKRGKTFMAKSSNRGKKVKYNQPQLLTYHEGYTFLENIMLVRVFLQKKHNLSFSVIEMLLYLYPKNYFTLDDYNEIPKQFTFFKIKKTIELGMIREVTQARKKADRLYCLSVKGRHVVEDFYMYLSGEKPIPTDRMQTMAKKDASLVDKKRQSLIKKLNAAGPPENKKRFYN